METHVWIYELDEIKNHIGMENNFQQSKTFELLQNLLNFKKTSTVIHTTNHIESKQINNDTWQITTLECNTEKGQEDYLVLRSDESSKTTPPLQLESHKTL